MKLLSGKIFHITTTSTNQNLRGGDFQVFVVSLMNLELFLKLYSDNTVKLNLHCFECILYGAEYTMSSRTRLESGQLWMIQLIFIFVFH